MLFHILMGFFIKCFFHQTDWLFLNAFWHRTFKRFSTAFAIVLMGFFLKSNVLFHWTNDFFSSAFAITDGFFLECFCHHDCQFYFSKCFIFLIKIKYFSFEIFQRNIFRVVLFTHIHIFNKYNSNSR